MLGMVAVFRFTVLGDGLVNLENDSTPRTRWPNSQLCSADLQHVSRLQTCPNLAASVDAHSLAAHGRDAQPTDGAGCQYGVPVIDSRRIELQVLTRSAADGQPACM
jgi:hypothetical protein